jgi:hypothetical protein
VAWSRGLKFQEAVRAVADYLGMGGSENGALPAKKKAAGTAKSKNDPAKDLEFVEWSSQLVEFLISKRLGITEESLLLAGARMAKYRRSTTVVALPIFGQSLDLENPVGWALLNATGGMLPVFGPDGKQTDQKKIKIAYGSKPGFIGRHGVERLRTASRIWKVEGVTDLLALLAVIPASQRDSDVVVTNSNGAMQCEPWMAGLLATAPSCVVGDCDAPGQAGASLWVQQIAGQGGSTRNVLLPYEVSETHGKDLRDWLNEGHTYAELLTLAGQSETKEIPQTADGEIDYSQQSFPIQELILRKLQIDVVYENKEGHVRVYSQITKKSTWIPRVHMLSLDDLIQIAGGPALTHVTEKDADGENIWSIGDVRKAIAVIASGRRLHGEERGIGIWATRDGDEAAIVLVNDTEALLWNGGPHIVTTPRHGGLVFEFGSENDDWFRPGEIVPLLERAKADRAWCNSVVDETVNLFEQWHWKNAEAPTIVAGLVLASWVQSLWDWRPLVAIAGERNTGKSLLFEALGGGDGRLGIFGRLALMAAKSSEAGLRQAISNTAKIAMVDEFENDKEREKILRTLRASSRGQYVVRGTVNQKGMRFRLRHLVWTAAIEPGLIAQADISRFIYLELLPAVAEKAGQLRVPSERDLIRLGQKLMAVAATHAIHARELASLLKSVQAPGIDQRIVESFAVPAAMLACIAGEEFSGASQLLLLLLNAVDQAEQGVSDQEMLLDEILSAVIHCGGKGTFSIRQIIQSIVGGFGSEHEQNMEAHGIAYERQTGDLLIYHSQVSRGLLRNRRGQKLDTILLRFPGARRDRTRMYDGDERTLRRVIRIPICADGKDF